MRVLAFRHVEFESLGWIERAIEEHGIAIDYADLYRPDAPFPALEGYAGMILMGGPMSANDPLDYLGWESRAIAQALARNQPMLGVCLGAQLIAKALGARVYPNGQKEIGWFDIHFTEAAARDPLFRGLSGPETIFHWHGETFDLPAGAVHLAWSEACRQQAFRYGDRVWGLQFHLEVTPAMVADWCGQDANCVDIKELPVLPPPAVHADRLKSLSNQVFGRWCELLEGREAPKAITPQFPR
jgi:GMP synthase-like glutamine amidotransferase